MREWHRLKSKGIEIQSLFWILPGFMYVRLSDKFICIWLWWVCGFYLFWGRWGLRNDGWRVRLLFSRFRTLSCCDIPRTLLLLVLGGIGWLDAYYNRYFGILLIAPFVFNEGHCNPLCIKLCKAAALCVYNKLVEQITRSRDSAQCCCRSL